MAALGLGGDWEGFPGMRVTFYLQSRCGLLRGGLFFFTMIYVFFCVVLQ